MIKNFIELSNELYIYALLNKGFIKSEIMDNLLNTFEQFVVFKEMDIEYVREKLEMHRKLFRSDECYGWFMERLTKIELNYKKGLY